MTKVGGEEPSDSDEYVVDSLEIDPTSRFHASGVARASSHPRGGTIAGVQTRTRVGGEEPADEDSALEADLGTQTLTFVGGEDTDSDRESDQTNETLWQRRYL